MTALRQFLTGMGMTGTLLVFPAVGWAAPNLANLANQHGYNFDAGKLGSQRLPSSPRAGFTAPDVHGGRATSEIPGTACDTTYGVQLVRDRDYLPDDVVHRFDGGRACDGPVTQSGLSWSSGRFHFDARVVQRQES